MAIAFVNGLDKGNVRDEELLKFILFAGEYRLSKNFLKNVMRYNRKDLTASFLTGTKSYLLTKPIYSGLGHILTFHRVVPDRGVKRVGNTEIEVTPHYLENIIEYFSKRNYAFISLDQLFLILKGEEKINNKFVVFTFDDGYVDNLTHAYPILKKHNIPFTIYVTTNFPDRKAIIWWYLLEDLILERDRVEIEVEGRPYRFECSTAREKMDTFSTIRALVIGIGEDNFADKMKTIFKPYGIDIYKKTDELALSWPQIQQLSMDSLVTIAAHTVNHYALNRLPEAVVKEEIMESKKKLESYTGGAVDHFAYPYGSGREIGEREGRIVKGLGFKTATTTRLANIFPAHRRHLECLPRIAAVDEKEFVNLNLWITGALPCVLYKFKRVITFEKVLTA